MLKWEFIIFCQPHWTNSPPKTPPETESSQTHIDWDLTQLPTHLPYCHYNCFEVTISTFQGIGPPKFLLVHLGWVFCDVKEPGKPYDVNFPQEYITSYRAFSFGPIWRKLFPSIYHLHISLCRRSSLNPSSPVSGIFFMNLCQSALDAGEW